MVCCDHTHSHNTSFIYSALHTQIQSFEQVQELMKLGHANRAVGSHDMNEHSSRSHSIITVVCRGRSKVDGSTTFGKKLAVRSIIAH